MKERKGRRKERRKKSQIYIPFIFELATNSESAAAGGGGGLAGVAEINNNFNYQYIQIWCFINNRDNSLQIVLIAGITNKYTEIELISL